MVMAMKNKLNRLCKTDWYEAALNLLVFGGGRGITIEGLTARLEVTKGSFYHHFGSFFNFKKGLLRFWEEKSTEKIKGWEFEPEGETVHWREILANLFHRTQREISIDNGFRSWGLQDETVRALIESVDRSRQSFIARRLRTILKDLNATEEVSRVLYMLYVGSQMVVPAVGGTEFLKMLENLNFPPMDT